MTRSFSNMFSSTGQLATGGSSGNAIVAAAAKRLHFSYKPILTNNGQESSADHVTDVPYVAVPFTVSREQLELAAASISSPGQIVTAAIRQIRNNQVVRTFPVDYAGAGQIQPPTLTVESIAASSFQTVAGRAFEFAAAYSDAAGSSPIGTPVLPSSSGLDMSIHRFDNAVYLVDNDVGLTTIPVANRKLDIAQAGNSYLTLAPYRSSDLKQAGSLDIPLGNRVSADWNDRLFAAGYNIPPTPYDSGSTAGNMEYCWGIQLTSNTMVRLSEILASARTQFYGSNGWEEEVIGDPLNNNRSFVNRGQRCLIKMGASGAAFMAPKATFFWRKEGTTQWVQAVNQTAGHNYIAGYTYVNNTLYDNSAKFTEANTMPSFAYAKEIRVNWRSYSTSLGLIGAAGNVAFYCKNNADQYVIPKNGVYVTLTNEHYSNYVYRGVPYTDTSVTSGSVNQVAILNLPDKQLMDDPSNRETIASPKGDEFFTGLTSAAFRISVPAHANATGATFYMREVTRSVTGQLTRGPWYVATGTIPEENTAFSKTVRSYFVNAVTPPATNTTNAYGNSYVGKVLWDGGANPVDFQVGDQFRLQSVNHNIPILGVPAELNISMEYNLK